MVCAHCGGPILPGESVCHNCGANPYAAPATLSEEQINAWRGFEQAGGIVPPQIQGFLRKKPRRKTAGAV